MRCTVDELSALSFIGSCSMRPHRHQLAELSMLCWSRWAAHQPRAVSAKLHSPMPCATTLPSTCSNRIHPSTNPCSQYPELKTAAPCGHTAIRLQCYKPEPHKDLPSHKGCFWRLSLSLGKTCPITFPVERNGHSSLSVLLSVRFGDP